MTTTEAVALSSAGEQERTTGLVELSTKSEDPDTVAESEKEQTRGQQEITTKRENLLNKDDPRVLLADRILDKLMDAIESDGTQQLKLKTFLCDQPSVKTLPHPLEIPSKDLARTLHTMREKSKKVQTTETQPRPDGHKQGRRQFQGQSHPFRIYVSKGENDNAFSTEPNLIVLKSGLLRSLAMDEGMIAAVVAHELAHLVQEHIQERRSHGTLLGILTGVTILWPMTLRFGSWATPFWVHLATEGSNLLVQKFFVQEQEHEADLLAMSILGLAGYDPRYMLDVHTYFLQNDRAKVHEPSKPLQRLSATHPPQIDRYRRCELAVKEISRKWILSDSIKQHQMEQQQMYRNDHSKKTEESTTFMS
ncbi:hypothetical protein BGZ83_010522 [Gryganskiella cystojenkinii]|nr:hypothetical protein BGZ83_010522 [Gryganskiella cystojenkinii]